MSDPFTDPEAADERIPAPEEPDEGAEQDELETPDPDDDLEDNEDD